MPFISVKNVVQIAFFAQRPLVYDCICFYILVCAEKFCYFRVKLCFARKIFPAFWGKNVISPENFLVCPENFLRWPPPPPPSPIFPGAIFKVPFFIREVPLKACSPPTFRSFLRPCSCCIGSCLIQSTQHRQFLWLRSPVSPVVKYSRTKKERHLLRSTEGNFLGNSLDRTVIELSSSNKVSCNLRWK